MASGAGAGGVYVFQPLGGDFNWDGTVDVSDLGILATNYGTGTAAAGAVPEPATFTLILGILCGLCLCRRR